MNKTAVSLFAITIALSAIGLFLIYESSSYTALYYLKDKYYFIKYQLAWVGIGIMLAVLLSRFDYRKLYGLALPLLMATFILLILVFLPGIGLKLKGANRWIDLKFIVFQPSELLKISLTLYLAAWLSNKGTKKLPSFLFLLCISLFLVAAEPDLGTAIIATATSLVVYFLSGAKIREIMVVLCLLFTIGFLLIKLEPYRVARIVSFQNLGSNSLSSTSYHIRQILIALGSGGVGGVGLGKSIQKYAYLPENTTDSIFAIYAEETGFIGSAILLIVFFAQIFLGFLISVKTQEKFGKLLSSGIITFLGAQTFINLASQAALIPLTGIPLPFISYGGSSMLINYISIGILLNIANKAK